MTRLQTEERVIYKKSHSKAFKEGIGILIEEIELALKWNRPSILLAIHNSKTGRMDAQQSLEQEIFKKGKQVTHISVDSANPDVILVMSEMPNSENTVFFVSGIENADHASEGKVHRALNIRRELLVERHICVVFWLNESEAANLPRLAPDFWSFRHRVVEFAPKRGTRKQALPVGLFLWEEQISWMEENSLKDKLAYYEKFLTHLPEEDEATAARIETILKLTHYSWLVNDTEKFSNFLNDGIALLGKYPIPHHKAWMFNAKGISLYEEGNKQDASTNFMQALSYDPENSAILMNLSIATHGLGRNSEAIQTGRRAIQKDKKNSQLWRILGYVFLSIGKMEEAIEAMKMTQDLNPGNVNNAYSLAVCYYKNEQTTECKDEILKAERISTAHNAIQHACIGILGGKIDEALTQLKDSLQKKEVSTYQILRDPNLHFLMNSKEFIGTQ